MSGVQGKKGDDKSREINVGMENDQVEINNCVVWSIGQICYWWHSLGFEHGSLGESTVALVRRSYLLCSSYYTLKGEDEGRQSTGTSK